MRENDDRHLPCCGVGWGGAHRWAPPFGSASRSPSPGEGDVVEARKTVGFIEGLARTARRAIPARIVPNRIRRGTTLSRHTLSEIEALSLPRLQTTLSEAVAYGELGFSGAIPIAGTAAAEIAALVAELRNCGWLPAYVNA